MQGLDEPARTAVAEHSNNHFSSLRFYIPKGNAPGSAICRRFKKEMGSVMKAKGMSDLEIKGVWHSLGSGHVLIPFVKI